MLSNSFARMTAFPPALLSPDSSTASNSLESYNFWTNAKRPKIRPRNSNQITTIQFDPRVTLMESQPSANTRIPHPNFSPFITTTARCQQRQSAQSLTTMSPSRRLVFSLLQRTATDPLVNRIRAPRDGKHHQRNHHISQFPRTKKFQDGRTIRDRQPTFHGEPRK